MPARDLRWTPLRKERVVLAVRAGLIALADVLQRYRMLPREFEQWDRGLDGGRSGLRATVYPRPGFGELVLAQCAWPRRSPVEIGGRQVHLTSLEASIIELLRAFPGRVVTTAMLMDWLYAGCEWAPEMKIVNVAVCELRKKLGAATIETVWGRGYAWRP